MDKNIYLNQSINALYLIILTIKIKAFIYEIILW